MKVAIYCKCGCGAEVPQNMNVHISRRAKYILGHQVKKDKIITEWIKTNQGKHRCICGCGKFIKIRRPHYWTGIPRYIQYHNKPINSMAGKKHSLESKKRISESSRGGNKTSFNTGHIPWSKGKERPDICGDKNPHWNGGTTYQGYNRREFNKKLKHRIKTRDGFFCKICGKAKKTLDIHHIDENKENNTPENLITVCHSCHSSFHNNPIFKEKDNQSLFV